MNLNEIKVLLADLESDRVERKKSISEKKKICQAICAFANDLPKHEKPGYVFIGVDDRGNLTGLNITDELLLTLANIRSDGNILPFPTMNVQKQIVEGKEIAVVEVFPNDFPPVRYEGIIRIRIGPRRAIATREEERRLSEKRISGNLTFDYCPVRIATVGDLDTKYFRNDYLSSAVAAETLEENNRALEDQLISLRFLSVDAFPTNAGLLVTGKAPQFWIPGAYVQFVRFDGAELTDPIKNQKELRGTLFHQLYQLDELLEINISLSTFVPDKGPEERYPDFPLRALQQLVRNAVLHRNYETSNAPVRINWFSDRVEISNPGGLFGQVTSNNFETTTDYRNPLLAEAMKNLGFVQRFGMGIQLAQKSLEQNDNPPAEFEFYPENSLVTVYKRT